MYFAGTHRRGSCHFVGLVDDHSRYLLGIRAVPTREALPILELLTEAVELCGVPIPLMTDNGTPVVAVVRSMLSRFQRTLADLAMAPLSMRRPHDLGWILLFRVSLWPQPDASKQDGADASRMLSSGVDMAIEVGIDGIDADGADRA